MEHMGGAADATTAAWRLHAFEFPHHMSPCRRFWVPGWLQWSPTLCWGADEKVEHCELNCSAAAALKFDCVLEDSKSVIESDGKVGIGDQASGRVDVPGVVSQLAAASQGPSMRFALPSTQNPQLWTHVTLLIRSLSGETLVVVSDLEELVSRFRIRLSVLTGIFRCHFYLTHQGRVLVDEN